MVTTCDGSSSAQTRKVGGAFFGTVIGFALVWHIVWMAILGLAGAYATFVVFAWRDHGEEVVSRDEVARIDRANRLARKVAITEVTT